MEIFGSTHNLAMVFLIGLVVGVIARFLMPGRQPGGVIVTALLGIVGSLVATWLGQTVGWYQAGQTAGWIGSVIGAIVVLAAWHAIRRGGS
ncbi:MAG: hypothetical protein RL684_3265 [Pseudomonadota bacterium]|jgi:uncharacterized membrane protein YeaQ/YmgE (transglycosylase-associated protein family)